MRSTHRLVLPLLLVAVTGCAANRGTVFPTAPEPATAGAATAAPPGIQPPAGGPSTSPWPAFRGPNRDGVYPGAIRTTWDGLTPMWKKPVGGGRASFSIAGDRAFTIEQRGGNEVVAAYEIATGRELWAHGWPERFSTLLGGGSGPRATPTFAEGLVYALGGRGELRCLDATTGRLVWRVNILQDTNADNLRWGMAGSPLVHGDAVIVLPGGSNNAFVAAYDRRTGARLWTALDDKTAYASPMHVTLVGVPQYLLVSASRVMGVSVDRREVLWEFPWTTGHDASAAQPIVIGENRIFYSSGYGGGATVVEVTKAGEKFAAKEIWRNIRMKNRQSSSVLHDGFIYGLDEGILACLDAATGELKWKGGRYGHGQLLLAGNHLVVITEDGELVLVSPTPEKLSEVARVPALDGETWNVPAFADGILLVRNTTEMAAFDLRPGATPPAPRFARSATALTRPVPRQAQSFAGTMIRQAPPARTASGGREFFISWGYNGDTYANSDIHISQPALGNDFTLADVRIRDSKTWTDLFNHSLFVPQYNFRVGMFFNDKWGVELALDHMKWIVREDQQVRITGTLNGSAVDAPLTLTADVLRYQLNNGANPIFINLIRRVHVAGQPYRPGHIAFFAKAGGGFAWPHTENTLFGQPNDKGFQPFHGWNLDAVAAVRIHLWRPFYFEAEEKLVYARYFGVKVDRGTARHSVKASEFTFSFGMAFR